MSMEAFSNKIAFVRKTATVPYKLFFNSGWETIEGINCFVGMEHLAEIDGQYDICIVGPGGFRPDQDLYRKRSPRTKFVYINEEDMHYSVEILRCIADYYDYLCIFSEINWIALRSLGVKNVLQILPAVDPRYFQPNMIDKSFDVTFIGQQGDYIRIGEGTRMDYLRRLDSMRGMMEPFIGQGFYCEDACEIYNKSWIALDLPISFAIGPRAVQIGATTATLMIPSGIRSKLWFDHFTPEHDYITFEPTFYGFQEALKMYLEDKAHLKQISDRMRAKILAGHTFQHRFNQIIREIQSQW